MALIGAPEAGKAWAGFGIPGVRYGAHGSGIRAGGPARVWGISAFLTVFNRSGPHAHCKGLMMTRAATRHNAVVS